ncbi:cob(I)yrinic acid a,c-diamide adenosyltransferase [Sphaerochaeta globosa]|jgi:cob(I)alamin adenosyltransferase|uniref:corrinoid adenosyltransferase n=1 Tax=Sphaerochaeta globosa (strain ATCC BAA-1886 / DSM 22777 / Buddy) TaxID=158189 RepID=F0RZX1_SPHGB|nr:cob(I)yrinic acid a,c-diamide adenosyltransferase [Sphaerochaeta globosa]ADY13782.1 ATP:corrinoid adenosyltransferase BtuR/CobO/CobP [Sphaerochaeta globosa str. Buddy]
MGKAMVLVYTGDGKGKSCASMGQLIRALGHGAHCAVAQFIKQDPEILGSGEYAIAKQLGVTWKHFGAGFTWEGDNNTVNAELAKRGWEQVKRWISASAFDVIVLDEFTYTLNFGYLDTDEVCTWISDHRSKEGFPHLVISGRNAPKALIAIADMVSEIQEVKHHLQQSGRKAEAMIEF